MSADISKLNRTPAPLLAPLDRVYTKGGEYLGMLSEVGAELDHEIVVLYFMYRAPMKFGTETIFYVDNADHIVR